MKKFILMILSLFLILTFVGCGKETEDNSIIDETKLPTNAATPNIMVVACSELSGIFNPFYSFNESDCDVVNMTSEYLLTFDRSGSVVENAISGETKSYNNSNCYYNGISNFSIIENEKDVTVKISLRNDVQFSDGEFMNIDDVIFSIYVLCDTNYDGPYSVSKLPIKGLEFYRENLADNIIGVRKIDDYNLEIDFNYYDMSFNSRLYIPVAPLHHYGDETLFDYENNKFGFPKGDLSNIKSNNSIPVGAGPYVFQKYENNTVYFSRNKYFYKGESEIPFIEFREISEDEKINEILNGNVHLSEIILNKETVSAIKSANGNKLDGSVLKTFTYERLGYGYIGISADKVKVGNDKSSTQSKSLRTAFCTVFSYYRKNAIDNYYGENGKVIDYPINSSSFLYPQNHSAAFSLDSKGNPIFNDEMNQEERYNAVFEAAKSYFINAGYEYDYVLNKFVAAPEGAKLFYDVTFVGLGKGAHPTYEIFINSKEMLEQLGITLNIIDLQNQTELWDKMDNFQCEIWSATWESGIVPYLSQVYGDSNHYGIYDDRLTLAIESSDNTQMQLIYENAFNLIREWAVELPVYERQNAFTVNSYSIEIDSLSGNYTSSYGWIDDIEHIKMKSIY